MNKEVTQAGLDVQQRMSDEAKAQVQHELDQARRTNCRLHWFNMKYVEPKPPYKEKP